jgi:hypothetical protein
MSFNFVISIGLMVFFDLFLQVFQQGVHDTHLPVSPALLYSAVGNIGDTRRLEE